MYDNPFGYGYFPPDPPPPPGLAELKAALKTAVRTQDIKEARKAFDSAFWYDVPLTPDWHDILLAALQGDKQMLRLLAAHGAGWTQAETLSLKDIYADQWADITATLRAAGMRVDSATGDPSVVQTMKMRHALRDAAGKDPAGLTGQQSSFKLEYDLSSAIAKCLAHNDAAAAAALLRMRHPSGPVSIQSEIWMASLMGGSNGLLLAIDTLKAQPNMSIRPLQLDAKLMASSPGLVGALAHRDMLDPHQPNRLALVEGWVHQPNSALDYKRAAQTLFSSTHPLSDAEADAFIDLYRKSFAEHPSAMDFVSNKLQETAFFHSSAWTRERLEKLASATPPGRAISAVFNSRIAADRFGKLSGAEILKPENFSAFLSAHEKGHYMASSRQSIDIIDALHRRLTTGLATHDQIRNILKTMKEGGARFGIGLQITDWTSAYFGKNEPGMIKILLDLGIIKADAVDMVAVSKKAGFSAREPDKIYWSDPANPWQQFYIQLYLERVLPATYVPLRGKVVSYREAFREAFFRDKAPPQPPKPSGPGGWFK